MRPTASPKQLAVRLGAEGNGEGHGIPPETVVEGGDETLLVGGLEHLFIFPSNYWECHHPN